MSSVIPEGWSRIQIGDIGSFFGGLTGKTAKDFGDGHPFLTYMQVYSQQTSDMEAMNSVLINEGEKQNTVAYGDVLFTTSSETPDEIGMTDVFLGVNQTPYLNSFCFGLRPITPSSIDPTFGKYVFRGDDFREDMRPLAQGSTRFNLSKGNLAKLSLLIPSLPEQKKIASILTSVDEVIENTQKQIDKLQDLKKATMNELLTKGIGHTEFKDSELGRIPKSWEVVTLNEVTVNHDSKRVPIKSVDRQNIQGKYRYYGASGVIDYVEDYIFDGRYILLGEDGENVLSRNLPLAFIVEGKFWVNNHAHILQPTETVDIGFLCEYLESLDYKNIASGSAQPKITKSALSDIKVKLPSAGEQLKIIGVLSSIDKTIEPFRQKLSQTQSLKKSLMQDLLTGKVQVTVN